MKKQPDYYYYNTGNLMNDMMHLEKQKFKAQVSDGKAVHQHANNQTVARNQSHYQSSSIIHNLSHTLSNSPQQEQIRSQQLRSKHSYKQQLQKDSSLSQQKLSSILSFMATKADFKTLKQTVQIINEQKRRKSGAEQPPETSEPETTKNLRKNQSMSDLPLTVSKTPNPSPLLQHYNGMIKKGTSTSKVKRQNISVNSFSKSNVAKQSNLEKMKVKIRKLLKDKSAASDDNPLEFQNKFNTLLLQITQSILNDTSHASQPPSSQDSLSNIQLEQVFKHQFQINASYNQLKHDKLQLEHQLAQLKAKNEQLHLQASLANTHLQESKAEKDRLVQNYEDLLKTKNQELILLKDEQSDDEKSELKCLVQGQFEAIQKLLQREQLLKVFLKKVGDSSIIKQVSLSIYVRMFEQFIQNAEYVDENETEGNLNIQVESEKKGEQKGVGLKQQEGQKRDGEQVQKILEKYQRPMEQLSYCDSLLADDSRVNDSDESSFRYLGKEQATELSEWMETGPALREQPMMKEKNMLPGQLKEKLRINIKSMSSQMQKRKKASEKSNETPQ